MKKKDITPEIIEKVKEVYKITNSIRKTRKELADTYNLTFHNVRDIIQGTIEEYKNKLEEHKEELEELNESVKEKKKLYEVSDDHYIFYLNIEDDYGNKISKPYPISIELVDSIFKDYSKHGNNLSSEKILQKYEIKPELWYALKNRLRLYKDSNVLSPITLQRLDGEEAEQKISDVIDETIQSKYKNSFVKQYEQQKNRQYNKMARLLSNQEAFLENMQKYIEEYKPKQFDFTPEKINNNDEIAVLFSDLHIGKMETDKVLERIRKMGIDLIKRKERKVNLVCLGDLFENITTEGMHPGQLQSMDYTDPYKIVMDTVEILEQLIMKLIQQGKEVLFSGIGGNHCFIKDDNPEFLTKQGYKPFDYIVENNMKVAQIGKSGEIEFVYPTGIINEYRYGRFITYKNRGKKQFTVTDGHKFIIDGKKIEAKYVDEFNINQTPKPKGKYKFTKVDELALLTIFDGTVVYVKDSKKRIPRFKRLQFKISKPEKIKYITEFLDKNAIHYTIRPATMSGCNKLQPYMIRIHGDIAREIDELIGRNKQIPKQWYNADEESKNKILDIIANTDGTLRGDKLRMYNTDESIISLCETLFITNKYKHKRSGFKANKDCYEINFTNSTKLHKAEEKFAGYEIVDFEMPNGNLFVRVGGTCFNHSNCRLTANTDGDQERVASLLTYELIKRGLQDTDTKFNILREGWNKLDMMGYNVILHHGDKGAIKKNTSQILWEMGDKDKHNIIAMGHVHHFEGADLTDNATKIIVPAMAGANVYDKSLLLSSYTGYVIIEKDEDGTPIQIVRRFNF